MIVPFILLISLLVSNVNSNNTVGYNLKEEKVNSSTNYNAKDVNSVIISTDRYNIEEETSSINTGISINNNSNNMSMLDDSNRINNSNSNNTLKNISIINEASTSDEKKNELPTDLHWAIVIVLIFAMFTFVLATAKFFCAIGRGRLLCVVRPTATVRATAQEEIATALDQDERLI